MKIDDDGWFNFVSFDSSFLHHILASSPRALFRTCFFFYPFSIVSSLHTISVIDKHYHVMTITTDVSFRMATSVISPCLEDGKNKSISVLFVRIETLESVILDIFDSTKETFNISFCHQYVIFLFVLFESGGG